jgi:hypothetical protein
VSGLRLPNLDPERAAKAMLPGEAGRPESNERKAAVPSKMLRGPTFHLKPLQRKSKALPDPRYGVPKLTKVLTDLHPSRHSTKYRPMSPPMECAIRTSLASVFPLRDRQADSHAEAFFANLLAVTRLSRRQS